MSNQINTIIVLGMHRSGTSCLAGSLQQNGVHFGNVSVNNKYNKKGNRENLEIMQLNERILQYNKGSWNNPPTNISWNETLEKEGLAIINSMQQENFSFWGFKDPRTLLTYPFWKNLLPHAKLIGSIRNPYSVAQSLTNRDPEFSKQNGLNLWLDYNNILLSLLEEEPFPIISFDLEDSEYLRQIKKISKDFSLPHLDHKDFFDQKLRSIKITPKTDDESDKYISIFTQLLKYAA